MSPMFEQHLCALLANLMMPQETASSSTKVLMLKPKY